MKNISCLCVLLGAIALGGCANVSASQTTVISQEEKEYKSSEYPVYINDQKIFGVLYTPKKMLEKMPAVIISHGFGADHTFNQKEAEELAKRGYVVYIYDFRGGGVNTKSDGKTTEMSVLTEKEDLEKVLKEIQNLDFVDKDRIYLFGKSQGGFVSSVVAAEHNDEVAGLILVYPAFCIADDAKTRFASLDEVPPVVKHMSMTIGKKYYEDVYNYDVYDKIPGYTKNTLIIHGDKDKIVNLSYSERAVEVYPNATLKVIKDGEHGFKGAQVDEELQYIYDYLNIK